ncbi:unnamed protein product [Dovyalis caffra]|uniref:Uncharacterized protein n=1 Tax=Dovyalis caffra TaxID=77055 RepID=A0AAV1R647_9ROSI|nr:unnamed protein product [Dovyalis caffra]
MNAERGPMCCPPTMEPNFENLITKTLHLPTELDPLVHKTASERDQTRIVQKGNIIVKNLKASWVHGLVLQQSKRRPTKNNYKVRPCDE